MRGGPATRSGRASRGWRGPVPASVLVGVAHARRHPLFRVPGMTTHGLALAEVLHPHDSHRVSGKPRLVRLLRDSAAREKGAAGSLGTTARSSAQGAMVALLADEREAGAEAGCGEGGEAGGALPPHGGRCGRSRAPAGGPLPVHGREQARPSLRRLALSSAKKKGGAGIRHPSH